MNETTRTIPRLRAVARIAAVLCLFAAVALVPAVAFAAVTTTTSPSPIPATAANFQAVTLGASGGTAPYTTFYQIDSGPVWTYSTLLGNVPVLSKFGSHTLTYWSADSTFATETPNVATVNITDSTKPLTQIPFPSGQAFDNSASFSLVATDNFLLPASYGMTTVGSGVASTQYKLLPGGFGHTSTATVAWTTGSTVATSAFGDYTIYMRSTDVAGNVEGTETAYFSVVDRTAPTSSDNATASPKLITLSATDNAGGSGVATIYYQIDGTAGDAWNVYSAPIVVSAAGVHTLTYYAVDKSGNNEAPHAVDFTVTVPDTTAPLSTLSGVAAGASLPNGSVAHITVVGADAGSGMAALHVTVDGVARPNVTAGVRAAGLFGAPDLGVPGSAHPGGTAASIISGNKSCIAAGCHPTLALPTAGTIDHTGITSGCVTCHGVVDAPAVVEPATHANHDPAWACNLCHGTSLVAAVMPADNGGNHFLGSEPDHDGVCADCHAFTIASTTPPSTASTFTATFDVSGTGSHTILYWSVDKAGNIEGQHSLTFSILPAPANTIQTALTIGSSASSIKLGKAFNLTGLLNGTPGANGLTVTLMAKKPGKSFYSYSSARLTYGAGGVASSWQNNNYKPTLKGTYSFYVSFAGSGLYLAAPNSTVVSVTVK